MFVAKWYTRASRVRIVIAKFDGRWKLPGGPYPIPELVALVGGILATLFLLPRLGQPLLTAGVGVTATAIAVGAMRKMSYSPVKFSTRVHRISRLYTSPISVSTGDEAQAVNATAEPGRPRRACSSPSGTRGPAAFASSSPSSMAAGSCPAAHTRSRNWSRLSAGSWRRCSYCHVWASRY